MDSGVLLCSPDARQKGYLHWKATVGTGVKSRVPCGPNPFTASLDVRTLGEEEEKNHKKTTKNSTVLSQSCQNVYCMTILQEEFWCFVNFELFEHCVCVTEPRTPPPPPPPPRLRLLEPKVNTKPRPSSFIFDCQIQMPWWTCEVLNFKNGCCGDCVWYYCSYLSF